MSMRDLDFMQQALILADEAAHVGEVPVGAVIVKDGAIIATAYNQPISLSDPTAHAEVLALRRAATFLNNYRLPGCDLYVTLEPCAMCAGAMVHARIRRLIFGASDPKSGAAGSVFTIAGTDKLNHSIEVVPGVLADEAAEKLQAFFKVRR